MAKQGILLVVDDNRNILTSLQYLLGEQQGFLYQSVLNGVLRILLVLAEDLIVSFLLNVGAFIAEDGNTAFDLFEVVLSLDIVFFQSSLDDFLHDGEEMGDNEGTEHAL